MKIDKELLKESSTIPSLIFVNNINNLQAGPWLLRNQFQSQMLQGGGGAKIIVQGCHIP